MILPGFYGFRDYRDNWVTLNLLFAHCSLLHSHLKTTHNCQKTTAGCDITTISSKIDLHNVLPAE